jgi:transposase
MQMAVPTDYKSLCELYQQAQLEIFQLKQQLQQLQKMMFSARSERFFPTDPDASQLSLDIQADTLATCSVIDTKRISYTKTNIAIEQKPLQHPGRMKLPGSLRREEIIIEPTQDITACKKMGEEITEVLEYQPGELYVKQYRRIKYAIPIAIGTGNSGVVIGELPSRPIEKAMAGEGLLAQIVIDKYVDHLPLYRQMQRFERSGVKLSYSTLTDWVSDTCKLITPLFEALKAEVLQSNYLHADETPIKVMDKNKNGETHRGYYWVYQNSNDKIVFFDYQEGRGREGPMEILQNFKGYLQTDGYVAYDVFDKKETITQIHCMAHARRMFNEALDNDRIVAEHAMHEIQKLYAIERNCKEQNLSLDAIKIIRQEQAVPILSALGKWMKEQYIHAIPKSSIGKALSYSIERWEKLSRYTENGMLNIDNNPVENSIRPVALGRKNYLFAGSHEAAKRSGMLYSLLGTCKMHGIEPYAWLKNVLAQIPNHPINKIKELLPHHWKK